MKRIKHRFVDLFVISALAACGSDGSGSDIPDIPDVGGLGEKLCGFVCPGQDVDGQPLAGIEQGNASISGVQKIDAFFGAVLSFETAADGVSDGIQQQLDLIKGDFKVETMAALEAQVTANLDAELDIDYEPARCAVDAQASLEASASCDVEASGGRAVVECKGSCEAQVTASASCDANAELRCTLPQVSGTCETGCRGTCTLPSASVACSGTCNGTCNGTCSAYVRDGANGMKCAGTCSGTCSGSCDVQLDAEASCTGSCRGECTITKTDGGCEGGIRAECRAKAGASFMCSGQCTGEFEPPMVSAECEASAKAQASVNVQCTPPRLAASYRLKATASLEFRSALKALVDVRLPALLQAVGRGNVVADAGEGLGVAAGGAIRGAIDAARTRVKLKTLNGIRCATNELPKATAIVDDAQERLTDSLMEVQAVMTALHLHT